MLKTEVLQHFGSVKAACKALRVTKSAVSQWGEIVPERIAYKAQVITGGVLQVNPASYSKKQRQTRAVQHVA